MSGGLLVGFYFGRREERSSLCNAVVRSLTLHGSAAATRMIVMRLGNIAPVSIALM